VIRVLRVGTSGFAYSSWRGRFYPEDLPRNRWLEYYSQVFDAVEINSTFYRLPRARTLEKWARLPDKSDFRFVLKAYRGLTHMLPADTGRGEFEERVRQMLELFSAMGNVIGGVLWQFPPSAGPDTHVWRVEVIGSISREYGIQAFVEVRNKAWWIIDLRRLGVVPVAYHMTAKSKLMHTPEEFVSGDVVYVRFHGYGRRYGGSYPDAFLEKWAEILKGKDGYAFFNNDADGHAPYNAMKLKELLKEKGEPV
jgi:uncharacterized protein YecE (DUF72 family)